MSMFNIVWTLVIGVLGAVYWLVMDSYKRSLDKLRDELFKEARERGWPVGEADSDQTK